MTPLSMAVLGSLLWVFGVTGWAMARNPGDLSRRYHQDPTAGRGGRASGSNRPVSNAVARASARMAPVILRLTPALLLVGAKQKIDAAGRPDGLDLHGYTVRKGRDLTLGLTASALMAVSGSLVSAALLGLAALVWQDVVLSRKARIRQAEIEHTLPDYLDVIAIVSKSGASFRESLHTVADELGGPLAEEFGTTLAQLDLGGSRRQVFTALAERNPGQAMSLFVSSLLQAEELGAPLAQTLGDIAVDMRIDVAQRAKRQATRAGGKISLVVSTLFLPAMMVLLGVGLFLTTGTNGGGLFGG